MKKTRLRIVQLCLSAIILLQAVSVFSGEWLLHYWYAGSLFVALNIFCVIVVLNEFRTISKFVQDSPDRNKIDADEPCVSTSR